MNRLILKLHEVLNFIKGFETMYTTSCMNKMIVKHEGKSYLVKIELISEQEELDIRCFDTYLR
jgi:sulfur relay (sulfurtransferase) DsrC/TusE family protein